MVGVIEKDGKLYYDWYIGKVDVIEKDKYDLL